MTIEVTTPVNNIRPEPAPSESWPPSRFERWRPWFMLAGVVILVIIAWFVFFWKPAMDCQLSQSKGPVKLEGDLAGIQSKVQYPKLLRWDDRGVETDNKITVNLLQTRTLPSEVITVTIVPKTDAVRLLDRNGIEINQPGNVTALFNVPARISFYVEHTNDLSINPWRSSACFEIFVASSIQATPQLRPIKELSFEFQVEGLWSKLAYDLIKLYGRQIMMLVASGGGLLGIGVVPRLQQRRKKIEGLVKQIEQYYIDDGRISKLRESYQHYAKLKVAWLFIQDLELEARYREVESRLWYEQALQFAHLWNLTEVLHSLAEAEKWYPDEKVEALDSLFQAVRLSELREVSLIESESLKSQLRLLLDQIPEGEAFKEFQLGLVRLLAQNTWLLRFFREELDQDILARRRARIVSILLTPQFFGLKERKAIVGVLRSKDLLVQTTALWVLAEVQKPPSIRLHVSTPEVVREWLNALPSSLTYNPFEIPNAEIEERLGYLEQHFLEHLPFQQLAHSSSVALFTSSGSGRTACHLMLKKKCDKEGSNVLAVEHVDFRDFIIHPDMISEDAHIHLFLQGAIAKLGVKPRTFRLPDLDLRRQLQEFLQQMSQWKYNEMWVLVDNIDAYAETQVNSELAVLLIQHLIGNMELLGLPNLYFKFFLPLELKDRLLKYHGFKTGRINVVDMKWTKEQLYQLLKLRLQQATNSDVPNPIDSLMCFVDRLTWPDLVEIDELLIQKAQNSPRRLITLVNILFQHRAQIWHESARVPEELFIRIVDLAILLEHLLRRSGM